MTTKPLHPPKPEYVQMWVGTCFALFDEIHHRVPTSEELIHFLNDAVAGNDHQREWIEQIEDAPPTPPTPSVAPLSPIRPDGMYLQNDEGRWFAKGCTDFLLYKRFLDGEDITPILQERADLGANILRVFGMVDSFSHWHPQEYGERYYTQLQAFCALLAGYGLYTYFTVFADTKVVMPDSKQQADHWARVVDELRAAGTAVVEVGNELDQHENGISFTPTEPAGILACRGSLGGDVPCILPPWSLSDFHARRDYPSAVKDMCVLELREGWSGYAGTRGPIWNGEPQGFGTNPKRWQSPERARELAGTAAGTSCGVYFHSDNGVYSQPFDDTTKSCAVAFFAALKK